MTGSFKLLKREEIDTTAWDETIYHSPDARLYACSSFLDCMAPGWMALIIGNYEYVMPLPVRRKIGIAYIFQPAFCQQLGVFAKQPITQEISDAMLTELQKHFKYAELNMHSNSLQTSYPFSIRKNYLLSLNDDFALLQKKFSRSAKRNIAKAKVQNISIAKKDDAEMLIHLHRQRYGNKLASAEDFIAIKKYFDTAIKNGSGHFYYAINKNGKAIASSGYIQYKDRLYFLINGNLQEGLDTGATHLLKEHVIRAFAGTKIYIDFEGSDTPSFARFYEQYGATQSDNYPSFIFNNLPFPLKQLKQWQVKKK